MTQRVIEYAIETEVGPLIEAIYSLDLPKKNMQFY